MSLLKVGDGKNKLEIDVCGRCLSVWCDTGEYETLAPPLPKSGERSMPELVAQASPEARERYADALLESIPEDVSPDDFDIGDILRDIARLIIGAPTLWRTVKPVSPIFTILMTLALPVAHVCIYYQFHDLYAASYRYRDFWCICASMAEKYGFDLSAPLNALTFPFVQTSGRMALFYAFLLFIPLAAVERRIGHARFIGLFFAFVAVSSLAQAFFATLGLTTGYLCGIVPIAIGFLTYTSFAWPDLRIRDRIGLMSVYSGIVGLLLLAFPMLNALALDFLSCGVGPIAACLALGAILGRRSRKLRCTAL
jgi:membrane associated rhomboid family serine protease